MPTLEQMVTEVQAQLRSYTRDQEMSTHLTTGINTTATTLTLADDVVVSRGRIQIDDELIWVDSIDRNTNVATVPPYGRGMDGTTAANHSAGARVVSQPLFPNKDVKDKINQVILSLGGHLYGVATSQLPVTPIGNAYELPATAVKVVSVQREYYTGADYDVEYLRRWKFDPNAQPSVAATGKVVYVYDPVGIPYNLNITYLTNPVALASGADFSTSGLPASCYDLVIMGTAGRMLATAASYMTTTRAVEPATTNVGPDAALQQSRLLQVMFQQRLEEEKLKFFNLFANRTHYTG